MKKQLLKYLFRLITFPVAWVWFLIWIAAKRTLGVILIVMWDCVLGPPYVYVICGKITFDLTYEAIPLWYHNLADYFLGRE